MKGTLKRDRTKIISVLLLSVFLIQLLLGATNSTQASSPEKSITIQLSFSHPTIELITLNNKQFSRISIEDCIHQSKPGHPVLPAKHLNILIPNKHTVTDIEISSYDRQQISANLEKTPIIPQQTPLVTSGNHSTNLLMNTSVYKQDKPVFSVPFESFGVTKCKGFPILNMLVYPLEYIPATGDCWFYSSLTVTIHLMFIGKHHNENPVRCLDEDIQYLEDIIDNPEDIDTYDDPGYDPLSTVDSICNPADTYEYVIITSNELNETSPETYTWGDLLQHRATMNNLNTTLVTVEAINACTAYWNETTRFNDSAAHLRAFLQDAYTNWETSYVLLGGDWDSSDATNQHVPVRLFTDYYSEIEGHSQYFMPCDLYFSNLDGTWWDETRSCWGGGRGSTANDQYAEVSLGRLPVSSLEEVSHCIEKIIWYDTTIDRDYVNTTGFFGGNLGGLFSVTSEEYMEEVRVGSDPYFYNCVGFEEWNTQHPSNPFDTSTQIYYDQGAAIPEDYQTVINNNQVCYLNHLGHGTTSSALDMNMNTLASLSNSKPFFSISQQCLSGRFTEGDTPEKLLLTKQNGGAFGLVWNTGYGWASSSDTNGPNQFIHRSFWDYFFTNDEQDWTFGQAITNAHDAIGAFAVNGGWHYSWCYNWYSTHFFGDPGQLMRQYIEAPPRHQIEAVSPQDNATNVNIGTIILEATVNDRDGQPMNISFWTNQTGFWDILSCQNLSINGTLQQPIEVFSKNTTLWWSVHVTRRNDPSWWLNTTYSFTTRPNHSVNPPASFSASLINITMVNLSWEKNTNATHTIIERNTVPQWNYSEGIEVCNTTNSFFIDTSLQPLTQYFYQAWSYDTVDHILSNDSSCCTITPINSPPNISTESPENQSTGQELQPCLSINITDVDADIINVSLWLYTTNNWTKIAQNTSWSGGIFSVQATECSTYETTYQWKVTASDGQTWSNQSFWFITEEERQPMTPPSSPPSTPSTVTDQPDNQPPELPSIDHPSSAMVLEPITLRIFINDPDKDQLQLIINWGDNTSTNWSQWYETNQTITVSHGYTKEGDYFISVNTKDEQGDESGWTEPSRITILENCTQSGQNDDDKNHFSIVTDVIDDMMTTMIHGPLQDSFTYHWDFGDGLFSTDHTPTHHYDKPGVYHITLTIYHEEEVVFTTSTSVHVEATSTSTSLVKENQYPESSFFILSGIACLIILSGSVLTFKKKHHQ